MRLRHKKNWAWLGLIGATFLCGWIGQGALRGAGTGTPASDSLEERYRQGIEHFKAGRRPEALAQFEAVSTQATGYLQLCATNMIGQMARLQGRSVDARTAFARMAQQARAVIAAERNQGDTAARAAALELLAGHYQVEIAEEERKWDQALQASDGLTEMVARDPRSAGCSDLPGLFEKRARLNWRIGRREEALRQIHAWLERWPEHPRAAVIRRAVLSLEQPGTDEPKLASLLAPLSAPADATSVNTENAGSIVVAGLPEPPRPELDALDGLLNTFPPTNRWRAALGLEKGWMLCEADRWQEAAELWAELARPSATEDSRTGRVIRDYAELSRALWFQRESRLTEAGELAMKVLARGPRGHAATLANGIHAAVTRRAELARTGLKCVVKELE